jgi:hypothetical protein
MSGLPRWKENQIRQDVPLAYLKHPKTSANGAGAHGAYPLGWNGTSVLFLEQTPGTRSEKRIRDRKEKNRLPRIILRVALLAAYLAVWLWVYSGQFGIHR